MCLCVWNWTLELCLTLSCPPSLVLSILHMAFIVSFLLPLSLPVSDTFICFLCLLSSLTPVWCSLWDINCFQVLWYRRLLCVMYKVTTKQRSENIHTCANTQTEQSWTAGKSFEIKCKYKYLQWLISIDYYHYRILFQMYIERQKLHLGKYVWFMILE